jgi:hypothetical protein
MTKLRRIASEGERERERARERGGERERERERESRSRLYEKGAEDPAGHFLTCLACLKSAAKACQFFLPR